MNLCEDQKGNDFAVYRQVIRGRYNPVRVAKNTVRSVLSLVRSANTMSICSVPSRLEAEQLIKSKDTSQWGYMSPGDCEISYNCNEISKTCQAIISPTRTYPLNEDILLPYPPDEKANIYMDFFADEFERIKIRAEYLMNGKFKGHTIRCIAVRNLQLLRKLFHESRISFNVVCSYSDAPARESDIFILYTLNLFIIRCIVFYQKFFKPFISEDPQDEQKLRNDFHSEIPNLPAFTWLFVHRPPLYKSDIANIRALTVEEISASSHNLKLSEDMGIPDSIKNELLEFLQLKGSIRINCKKNVFLNEIYKMLYEKKFDGKCMITTEKKKLIKALSFLVIDDEGQPLSPATINTVTKPSNIKKRPCI